jgi:NACHT conflict system protein
LQAFLERAGTNQPQRITILSDLLAAHGRQEHGERMIVDHNTKPALVSAISNWISVMLASPSATRHQFSNVVRAIERFPDASFAEGLRQMLERDLSDREKAKAAYLSSPRRSSLSPDVSHSYTLDYQTAFAAIGGAEVIAILKEYLTDLRFGACAAAALYMIWTQENVPATERKFIGRYDYSRARELRRRREEAPGKMTSSDFAEAIFAAVRSLGKSDADEARQMQALALATTGLGIPHGDKRSEIDVLLALPLPSAVKQRLLIGAAMVGEIVPADVLINGFRELLEIGKSQSWRLAEDRGELMGWIELFPFSDRPEALFDVLDDLPEGYRYARSMERLLSAIAKSPHPAILDVLIKLGERDEKLQADHGWLDALMELKTEDSALVLLNFICEERLTGRRLFDSHRIPNRLATTAEVFPAVRATMLEKYERIGRSRGKALLEAALIELADPSIILLLIAGYAKDGRPYDGGLVHAIRQVSLGRRSVEGWAAGGYEEFGISLGDLRKDLFSIATTEGDARSVLARQCLDEIETLRDEYGRIDDEPRHPDIASGREWPLLTRSVVQSPT